MPDPDVPIIRIEDLHKNFGPIRALRGVSLDIVQGEIVTLLGPSGCGKTTLLRTIAGFERPASGRVLLEGRDVTDAPPNRRPVNLVFQRYALFPHLDVFENVAFGLRLKRLPRSQINELVNRMLAIVQLPDFGERRIEQLSGGQAQRVALARALVNAPKVLLLDEPLAALDLKIRQQMLLELKRIHVEVGITFVFVTHDQVEAMVLSDRIVLMQDGRIVQIGSPEEVYLRPRTLFAARFLGDINIIAGKIAEVGSGDLAIDAEGSRFVGHGDSYRVGDKVNLCIRPEAIRLDAGRIPSGSNLLYGTLQDVIFVGDRVIYHVALPSGNVVKCQAPRTTALREPTADMDLTLTWEADMTIIPCDTETGSES
jgi:spermidine/putrescine ABC transporter ATP-binding subunit